MPRDRYLADQTLQAVAERHLHLASEVMLDVAHHVIADRGLRYADSYREAMTILGEAGIVEPELATRLEGWMGLRNVLVHLYLDIDQERLFEVLQNELDDLDQFGAAIAGLL